MRVDFRPERIRRDREAVEPNEARRREAEDEGEISARRQRGPECSEHHRAVDQGLGVKPRHDERGNDDLREWLVDVLAAIQARLRPYEAYAYVYHQQAAKPEHDLFEPRERVHERAGAEEAGDPQGNVPEHNHERRRQGSAEFMAQCVVDDEEVLHADGGQKRQAQR